MKNYAIYVGGIIAFVTMNEDNFNQKLIEYKEKYSDVEAVYWID